MGEAIIGRASSGGSGCLFSGMTLDQYNSLIEDKVQIAISQNSAGQSIYRVAGTYQFTVPKTGVYDVICIGGGGGGGDQDTSWTGSWFNGGGGAAGYTNSGMINLNKGDIISLTVGKGGNLREGGEQGLTLAESGGTTSFGSYLSANGGGGGAPSYMAYSKSWSWTNGYGSLNGGKKANGYIGANGWEVPSLQNGPYGKGGNGGGGYYNSSSGDMENYVYVENGANGCVYISWT